MGHGDARDLKVKETMTNFGLPFLISVDTKTELIMDGLNERDYHFHYGPFNSVIKICKS